VWQDDRFIKCNVAVFAEFAAKPSDKVDFFTNFLNGQLLFVWLLFIQDLGFLFK
jgi:hypothetical protein